MKKTILKIFLTIFIPSFIILFPILTMDYTMSDYDLKVDNANIDIIINEDGTSKIIEEMKYVPEKEIDRVVKENLPIFSSDMQKCGTETYSSVSDCLRKNSLYTYINNIVVYKDNNMIAKNNDIQYIRDNAQRINFSPTKEPFNIKYIYYMDKSFISKYNDLSVLKYNLTTERLNGIKNVNISIKLPNNSKVFNINNKVSSGKIEQSKINSKQYNIYKKDIKKSNFFRGDGEMNLIVSFDSEVLSNKSLDYNFNIPNDKLNFYKSDKNEFLDVPILDLVLILIILIFSIYKVVRLLIIKFKYKKKINVDYYRNVDNLISPELSSIIVNNKFELKPFIMSCLLNLYDKNIITIDNKEITINKVDDLNDVDRKVLELIFCSNNLKNKQISSFDNINQKFRKEENINFLKDKIKEINNISLNILYKKNIYDEAKGNKIKCSKTFSIINFCCLIAYLILILQDMSSILLIINIILLLLLEFSILKVNFIKEKMREYLKRLSITKIYIIIMCAMSLICISIYFKITVLLIILILFINLYIFSFRDDEILTSNGYNELSKLLGLKKFIIDFGVMEEKNIDDIKLWEKYLTYAVAFEIPVNIMKNLQDNILNFNIILKDIEKIVSIT